MGICSDQPPLEDTFSEEDDEVAIGGAKPSKKNSTRKRRSTRIPLSTQGTSRVKPRRLVASRPSEYARRRLVTWDHKETLKKCRGVIDELVEFETRSMDWNHKINEIINLLESVKLKAFLNAAVRVKERCLEAITNGSQVDKEIGSHFQPYVMTWESAKQSFYRNEKDLGSKTSLINDLDILQPSVLNIDGDILPKDLIIESSLEEKPKLPSPPLEKFLPTAYEQQFPSIRNLRDWNFDIFAFSNETTKRPLSTMFLYICLDMNIQNQIAGIDMSRLSSFIQEVEKDYGDGPYHNFLHGADVLHGAFNLMQRPYLKNNLDPVHRFAMLFAAAVHDYRHPGLSNDFLIETNDEKAITYNDTSVLENWHCSQAFELLMKSEFNFLEKVDANVRSIIRRKAIQAILMTDMKKHAGHVMELAELNDNREHEDIKIDPGKLIYLGLHVCDLSHPTKTFDIHEEWSKRLTTEFLEQGDKELELGMTPSALFDRRKVNVEKGQIGFIDFIILPLWVNWTTCVGADEEIMDRIEVNKEEWKRRAGIKSEEKKSRISIPTSDEDKEEKEVELAPVVRQSSGRLNAVETVTVTDLKLPCATVNSTKQNNQLNNLSMLTANGEKLGLSQELTPQKKSRQKCIIKKSPRLSVPSRVRPSLEPGSSPSKLIHSNGLDSQLLNRSASQLEMLQESSELILVNSAIHSDLLIDIQTPDETPPRKENCQKFELQALSTESSRDLDWTGRVTLSRIESDPVPNIVKEGTSDGK